MRVLAPALVALLLLAPAVAGAAQLTLSWTDNAVDEQGFKVERCQVVSPAVTCANYLQIASTPASAGVGSTSVWSNVNLVVGVTYCYRVRAYNATGNSLYSNEACAAVPAPTAPSEPLNLQIQ